MTTAKSRREISFRDYLDEKEKEALLELTALCNAADGAHYSPPDDADCFFLLWEIPETDTGADEKGSAGDSAADKRKACDGGRHCIVRETASGNLAEQGRIDQEENASVSEKTRRLTAVLCVFHMGDTREGKEIDELSAFTRPEARRSGCFRRLLETAAPLLRPLLRFAVYRTQETDAVLTAIGAVHGGDEHMMELRLREWSDEKAVCESAGRSQQECAQEFGTPYRTQIASPVVKSAQKCGRDKETAASGQSEKLQLKYLADADGMDVQAKQGMCACRFYGDRVYLYGMLIYARYRRKGFGRRFLTALFARLKADGYHSVLLEVSSENLPAMKLYTSLGFEIKETVSYFYREH